MQFRRPTLSEIQRTRLLAMVLLFALVLSLPGPVGDLKSKEELALLMVWFGALLTTWSLWFRRDLLDLFWVVATIGSLLMYFFSGTKFLIFSFIVWRYWFYFRESRTRNLNILLFVLAFAGLMNPGYLIAQTVSTQSSSTGDSAAYLKGFKINDLTSCRQVDSIPWTFGEGNRQVRLLLRDRLRLSSEMQYSDWSVYQTMDSDGIVTLIFERLHSDGAKEYQLTKGSTFNRIIKRKRTSEVATVKDLKNLIDSPALEFLHQDGSRLSFMPGSSGSSKLRIYLSPKPGARILPPLFLEGRHCTRPESAFDQDDDTGKLTPGATPAQIAPVAGGSATAGGAPPAK